jgi:diphosphomevalonate decarboxylase
MRATAYAHTNIALVKYWGKRAGVDRSLNLPAVGSLSLTLDRFGSETTVQVGVGAADAFSLDGTPVEGEELRRVSAFLDLVRARAKTNERARVTSRNDVPTAAGLASSASGFAALAVAGAKAFGLDVDAAELSQLARRGSGSAARSLFGGFVELKKGVRDDGADCVASPLATSLDVRLLVVRCAVGRKHTDSTGGMDTTAKTSPYFSSWIETHEADLARARDALARGDLPALGAVMEHNTMKMHASAMAADPWILYLNGVTVAVLHEVRALRSQGFGAWATMDAGPHVKVLCAPADAEPLRAKLAEVPGVLGVEIAAPGGPARILS